MENGSKIVSSAILGFDAKTVLVGGKVYFVKPPTIRKLLGMSYYLSEIDEGDSVVAILRALTSDAAAHALSFGIEGNDSLYEEFLDATPEEVVSALEEVFSLIRTENFIRLSALTKSIARLIAKPKL